MAVGNHTISAKASTVRRDKHWKRQFHGGECCYVKKAGDVNGDGVVTMIDVLLAAVASGGHGIPARTRTGTT